MAANDFICEKCGYIGSNYKKGKFIRKGRTRYVIFLFILGAIFSISAYMISSHCLWSLIWFFPFLIYTIYDVSGSHRKKCPECKYEPLVLLNSKLGKKIQYSFEVAQKKLEEINDTKECPYCAETIKAKAKVCRFCGADLTDDKTSEDIEDENKEE